MATWDQICWPAHVAATLYMTGLIWFVQIVHYPLMAFVGRESYVEYQRRHQLLTTWVVGPAMLIEALTSLYLCWRPPLGLSWTSSLVGVLLVLAIWASTATMQMPCHESLAAGFDPATHRRLVLSNWIRTVLWTARAGLALFGIWQVIGNS
ncbi:MAG: hypothetical protein U1A77_23925 [Pirellulales bacterium]